MIDLNWATKTNSIGVFLDFRKVSDTVDHDILLQKLHGLCVRGKVCAVIGSYLADRKQSVNVNSENSNLRLVKRGSLKGQFSDRFYFLCT